MAEISTEARNGQVLLTLADVVYTVTPDMARTISDIMAERADEAQRQQTLMEPPKKKRTYRPRKPKTHLATK
jgi:hypothetical protein